MLPKSYLNRQFVYCISLASVFLILLLLKVHYTDDIISQNDRPQFPKNEDSKTIIPGTPNRYYNNYEAMCSDSDAGAGDCLRMIDDRASHRYWHNFTFQDDEVLDLRNVLLIVHFNSENYAPATKIYALYSRIFADIVFCGPGVDQSRFWPLWPVTKERAHLLSLPETVRFIPYGAPGLLYGENTYNCLDLTLASDPKASTYDGVLITNSDVTLNYWTWRPASLSLDKNWMIAVGQTRTIFEIDQGWFCNRADFHPSESERVECHPKMWPHWGWFTSYKAQYQAFYHDLQELAMLGDFETNYWRRAYVSLAALAGDRRRLFRGPSELFYISQQYLQTIRPILGLFNRHRVWKEVAIVTAIRVVTPGHEVQFLDVSGNYYSKRAGKVIDAYGANYQFINPLKLNNVFKHLDFNDEQFNAIFNVDNHDILTLGLVNNNVNDNHHGPGHHNNNNILMEDDNTMACLFCYLLKMSHAYANHLNRLLQKLM